MDAQEPLKEKRWYLKWWSIFVLFVTIGPFGLPFLWKSKDFNLFWKWFWTIAILVLTAAITWTTWKLIKLTLEHFQSLGLV